MRNLLKLSVAFFFLLELIMPSIGFAKEYPPPSPIALDKLPANIKERINISVAQDIFRRYQAAKTGKDFEKLFLGVIPEKDRKELLEKSFPLKEYASLSINKAVLTFKWKDATITLEPTEIWNQKFRINGKDWTYSTRISAAKNIENLHYFLLKITHSKESAHFLWHTLVPDANAQAWMRAGSWVIDKFSNNIGPMILVMIMTGGGSKILDAACSTAKEQWDTDIRKAGISCDNYYATREEMNKKELGTFDPFMGSKEKESLLSKFELDVEPCPKNPTKDAFTIKVRIRKSETNPESLPQKQVPSGSVLSAPADPFVNGAAPVEVQTASVKDGVASLTTAAVPTVPSAPAPKIEDVQTVPAPAPVSKESLRTWSKVTVKIKENGVPEELVMSADTSGDTVKEEDIICRIKFNADASVSQIEVPNGNYDPKNPVPLVPYTGSEVVSRLNPKTNIDKTQVEKIATIQLGKSVETLSYFKERMRQCSGTAVKTVPRADVPPPMAVPMSK